MSTAVLGITTSGRSVLDIAGDVAIKVSLEKPTSLFSSQDRTSQELCEVLIEATDRIVRAHDWQRLKVLQSHAGNGAQTAFDLPSDYLRMPKDAEVWSTRWQHPLLHISPEDWLHLDVREFDTVQGTWSAFSDQINYRPALASGETAKFWYVANAAVTDSGGVQKSTFSEDGDLFRLDDRLLKLCAIWVWREGKSLDFAEEMRTFETALAREISDDRAARIITQSPRMSKRANIAYPWNITP